MPLALVDYVPVQRTICQVATIQDADEKCPGLLASRFLAIDAWGFFLLVIIMTSKSVGTKGVSAKKDTGHCWRKSGSYVTRNFNNVLKMTHCLVILFNFV